MAFEQADTELSGAFLDNVRRYADKAYGRDRRTSAQQSTRGYDASAWADYAELGWLALHLAPEEGGLAGDPVAVMGLMREVGARLFMEPLLVSGVLAASVLRRCDPTQDGVALLKDMATGRRIVGVAHHDNPASHRCEMRAGRLSGFSRAVLHAPAAHHLLVSFVDAAAPQCAGLALVDMATVQRADVRMVDGRTASDCHFEATPARSLEPAPGSPVPLQLLREMAVTALCSEALGAVRALLLATRRYLGERIQFGQPIGRNQVLQHRMAEMYMLEREIAALTDHCVLTANQQKPRPSRTTAGARVYVVSASQKIALDCVQMHGGMGMTEELEISHWLRRLLVNGALFGGREDHMRIFMDNAVP